MVDRTTSRKPSLRVERQLQRAGHRLLAGMDEVGRGALAGPVSVGVVVIDETVRSAPTGVKDSKLLTERARKGLVPRIQRWAVAHAVGHASADEIDEVGIIAALRLAGVRALSAIDLVPDLVILDGNHDWLTSPDQVGLLAFATDAGPSSPPVTTMILGCRGQRAREGGARRADGAARSRPPGIRLDPQQGVLGAGAHGGVGPFGALRAASPVVAAARRVRGGFRPVGR